MIYEVVNASIRSLLNPELTASWEKGLTYVAEGSITSREYMDKLEHFIRVRTSGVMKLNNQYALRTLYDNIAVNYKKAAARPAAHRQKEKEAGAAAGSGADNGTVT